MSNDDAVQRWKNAMLEDATGGWCWVPGLVIATTSVLVLVVIVRTVLERGVVAATAEVAGCHGTIVLVVFRGSVVSTTTGVCERSVVTSAASER
jgi:hypothetical protein